METKICPNCGATMNPGEVCPECEHTEAEGCYCEHCDDRVLCSVCGGAGWVDDPSDGGTMTCPDCGGEGRI